MCPSILGFQAPLLRSIADELQLPPVAEIARQPGTHEVYRITVHYFDGRACNSVATLRGSAIREVVLEVLYQRALNRKPLTHPIEADRYTAFVQALKSVSFDHMGDQPELPAYNSTDLWLIERAAGTFSHSVILVPELAHDHYRRLANAVKNGLSEALRQVK
ncbi:MAG: hypothetical protein ABI835_07325 [Chloroflexota bacterium]